MIGPTSSEMENKNFTKGKYTKVGRIYNNMFSTLASGTVL